MLGFFHIFKLENIYILNIIKAKDKSVEILDSNNFEYFEKRYTTYPGVTFIDIIGMDDNLIEFISDIDTFVTTNESMFHNLNEIIDTYIFIDDTNTKDIYTIAKEYDIKIKEENSKNNAFLVKIVLMAYKKKFIDNVSLGPQEIESASAKQAIKLEEVCSLMLSGISLSLNINEENRGLLSVNASKLFDMFRVMSEKEENINLINFIDENLKRNFNLFFKLLNELVNKQIIEERNYIEIKNTYFNIKQNSQYQTYLEKSIEKGLNIDILKEQIDLLLLKEA